MTIDVTNRKLHAPDFTFQLNEITLKTTRKIQIHPNSQEVLQCYPSNDLPDGIVGIIDPNPRFERKTGLCMTSSLSKITHNQTLLAFLNCTTNIITLPKDTIVGNFTILTPKQSQYLQPVHPAILSTISPLSLNELIHADENCPIFGESDFWFPSPETCSDPSSLTGLHRKIYQILVSLKTAKKLDPTLDATQRQAFLNHFNWKKSILSLAEREQVEALLIEFHDIFARHRFDVGGNDHFSVKLTPEHHDPVYTQSPTTPIRLREEILHDLAQPWLIQNTQAPSFKILKHIENHWENCDFWWIYVKLTTLSAMITTQRIFRSLRWLMQVPTLPAKAFLLNLIVARHTTHSKWLTLCQSKSWLSILPRVRLPSNDWHKA